MISAIVLIGGTYDQKLLKRCLDSVSWCDEVIKVETNSGSGSFAEWRNKGSKMAKGEWLLYVDTDEEITSDLQKEIEFTIYKDSIASRVQFTKSAYAIPRRNVFLGHEMRWGGWSPDYVLRLIKKDKLIEWQGNLHEQPKINGEVAHLNEPMIHVTHRNLSEMVEKTNDWSEIEAKLLYDSGHPKMVWWRFVSVAFREFWYRAVVKLGFLDGPVGIIEIIFQMFSRMITYTKLWEMQLKNKK